MSGRKTKTACRVIGRIFYILLFALTVIITLSTFALTFMLVADVATEAQARILPPYAKEDVLPTLEKAEWTEKDYEFLYRQTGLGKAPLDQLKGNTEEILTFQEALFADLELSHIYAAPTTPHEITDVYAPLAPIEEGDVFVTSSCHTYGWRNGHAALVTNAQYALLLQSIAPGTLSRLESANWFLNSSNFMILRLKNKSVEERAEIAQNAQKHYMGIPYSLTVGIFSEKDQGTQLEATNCSHLVWQAFKAKGYDIDSDGGPICTARDIANYAGFEVVQVYGFDPLKLWK